MIYTPEVAYLNITSWVNTIALGIHWYGKIEWYDTIYVPDPNILGYRKVHKTEVLNVLDAKSAKRLNEEDSVLECSLCAYKAGETTGRFWSCNDLIRQAQKTFKIIVPHGRVLLQCDHIQTGPTEVLYGPRRLIIFGNNLYKRWVDCRNDDEELDIEAKWRKLFKHFNLI